MTDEDSPLYRCAGCHAVAIKTTEQRDGEVVMVCPNCGARVAARSPNLPRAYDPSATPRSQRDARTY